MGDGLARGCYPRILVAHWEGTVTQLSRSTPTPTPAPHRNLTCSFPFSPSSGPTDKPLLFSSFRADMPL